MPFYMNVFNQEYRIPLTSGDRPFVIPANTNCAQQIVGLIPGPFNLTGLTTLTINYSFDSGRIYTPIAVNVAAGAVDVTAVTPFEVVNNLRSNPTFNALFGAEVRTNTVKFVQYDYVTITLRRARPEARVYVSNSGAESKIGFNSQAPVVELPTYFNRHVVGSSFSDSTGSLILLDEGDVVDQAVITRAGLDYNTVQADWQLVRGRGGYNFQKITVDGSDRITDILEYPAGSIEGDMGKLIHYTYTGANTRPSEITEIPYTLTNADLITPP